MRPIGDGVVCRERAELDPGLTTIKGFVMPEISRKLSPTVQPDHMCYGEIVQIASGSINQPRIDGISKGDVVLYDLANVDHAYIDGERGYQKMSQKALAAVLVEGEPHALTDWVITVRDHDAMRRMLGVSYHVPDHVLNEGQRTDDRVSGSMRLIAERVVSVGAGRRYRVRQLPRGDEKRLAYDDIRAPDRWIECMSAPRDEIAVGDVAVFSPSASTEFRRNGQYYRATPFDEIHGVLERT